MALTVPIVADTSGLVRGLGKAQGRLRSFSKFAVIAAGAAGVGALVQTLRIGTKEFMEQQKVAAQTGAVLKSTGGVANVTAKQIESLSAALMKKSGVDDEAIASGQNLLLTFTKIRNEAGKGNDIFDQATVAMLDLSVAMGKDLNSSAILVGKALNDPIKGAAALSRAGVQLTKDQRAQIEAFVESGRVLEAQKVILAELTTQFGGSAEAAGKTLPGQLNILKQTFNNLAGQLAATFLPSLARAATKLVDFLSRFSAAPTLKAKAEIVIRGIVDAAGRVFRDLITWWTTTQRIELPARVIIVPSGKQQFDRFFTDLEAKARASGIKTGRAFVQFFFNLFTSEGRAKAGDSIRQIAEQIGEVGKFLFRITGATLQINLIAGFYKGAGLELFNALKKALDEAGRLLLSPSRVLGEKLQEALGLGANRRAGKKGGLKDVLTKTVRDAVQAARSTLTGMAGSLGGMVADIIGGTSPAAKRAREIRKQLRLDQARREEKRLRDAIAQAETDEDRKAAQQDLDDFLLDEEAQRLEDSVEQQKSANEQAIADLTESFNQGAMSAQEFADRLNGIIGENRGAELGTAFAKAFERELQGIINVANDIANVVGTGEKIAAVAGGGVAEAVKEDKEKREADFKRALRKWQEGRDEIVERLEKKFKKQGSDGGEKITQDERNQIAAAVNKYVKENPKPKRADFGLAMGGILRRPTFVAGEAGKEAVIPLESGSAMRILRDAIGGRGGGSSQVINLTVNAGLGTNPDELSQVIVQAIKRYEKRNGAVFQGPIVSTLANISGKTDTTSTAATFNRARSLRTG